MLKITNAALRGRRKRTKIMKSPRFICCAIIALTLSQILSVTGVRSQVRHTVIAASGDAAPAGGSYKDFLNTLAVNARGQVAFDARLNGPSTTGVFVSDHISTSAIALGGNPDPTAGNFNFVSAPFITTRGDVIFNTDTGIFRNDGNRTVALVQNGDAAPGGGTLTASRYAANSQGLIAFAAFVTGGLHTEGVFRNDGTQTIAIALDGIPSPTGGTFLFFSSPVIDEHGQAAFFAGTTGGSADFGIYRGDGKNIATIFAANQPAPGGGTFVDFGEPVTNNHGQVLSLASLDNAAGPFGLILGDGTDAVAIALSGHAAAKGGIYATGVALQFLSPVLNDRGQVAFAAFLKSGTSASGIFRGDGTTTIPIALEGTAAAGTTGTFASFGKITMGNDGRVVFIATLTPGVGGVDQSNNIGIWTGTSETDLHLLARTGEVIAGKTLTRPLTLGPVQINSERPIVWLGRFADNSTAIISSEIDGESEH
jgi:hypothetical protein